MQIACNFLTQTQTYMRLSASALSSTSVGPRKRERESIIPMWSAQHCVRATVRHIRHTCHAQTATRRQRQNWIRSKRSRDVRTPKACAHNGRMARTFIIYAICCRYFLVTRMQVDDNRQAHANTHARMKVCLIASLRRCVVASLLRPLTCFAYYTFVRHATH